jgi:hypothetical protein
MNWKGGEKKRSWRNLCYYPGSYPKTLRKTTITFSQDGRSLGVDMNPGTLKYKAGVPVT